MNIFKFVVHVCARGHVHLYVHVSSESLWVILCVFIFGLQLVLPLWAGVCVWKRTLAWACTCVCAVFSAVARLPHTWSVSDWGCSGQPWPTCLFLRRCHLVGLISSVYSACFDWGTCQYLVWKLSPWLVVKIHYCAPLWKMICLVFFSLLRVVNRLFSKGNCSIWERESRINKQTQRGDALHPGHSLLILYHLCDSDELWMRL